MEDFVNKPTIDELLEQIDSKYSLVVIAAKEPVPLPDKQTRIT